MNGDCESGCRHGTERKLVVIDDGRITYLLPSLFREMMNLKRYFHRFGTQKESYWCHSGLLLPSETTKRQRPLTFARLYSKHKSYVL
jgi:hypothetical protein